MINQQLGRRGTFWQDENFDHILRSDEGLLEKVNYVANNAVRKGLVERPEDYPWFWSPG